MLLKKLFQYWQSSLSLFLRLLIGFGLVLAAAFLMVLLNFTQLQAVSTSFEQLERVQTRVKLTSDLQTLIVTQVADTLDQLWSGRLTSQSQDFDALTTSYFNQLRESQPDSQLQTQLDLLQKRIKESSAFLSQTVTLDGQGKSLEARASWINGSILFRELTGQARQIEQSQQDLLTRTRQEVNQTKDVALLVIVICSLITFLLALGMVFLITRSIVERVQLLNRAMQQIADDNGLQTVEISVAGKDELALMAQSFNRMIVKLRTAVQFLHNTGQTVSTSSDYFNQMMHRQLVVAEQEVSAVSAIVGAAGQLKLSARQIDQQVESMFQQAQTNLTNINQLTHYIVTSSEQTTRTNHTIQTVISGINQMREETGEVSSQVQDLLAELGSIRRLSEGLKEIASQTHLLALNAAIESAGAGQDGDRFNVIATSIRSLADQSQKLVARMNGFIQAIESRVENVTCALHSTNEELSHSRELVTVIEQIGQDNFRLATSMSGSLKEISKLVAETVRQAQTIAISTREQHHATEEIIATITNVESVVNDSRLQHTNNIEAVTVLQAEVSRLNQLVGNLNVAVAAV